MKTSIRVFVISMATLFSLSAFAGAKARIVSVEFPWTNNSDSIARMLVDAFASEVSGEFPRKQYGKVTLSFEQNEEDVQIYTLLEGENVIRAELAFKSGKLNVVRYRASFELAANCIQGDAVWGDLEARPSFKLSWNSKQNSIQSTLFELLDHVYVAWERKEHPRGEAVKFRKAMYSRSLDFFVLESKQGILIVKEKSESKKPSYEAIFSFFADQNISYLNLKKRDDEAISFAKRYAAYYAKKKSEGYDIEPIAGVILVGKELEISEETLELLTGDNAFMGGLRYLRGDSSDETRAIFLFLAVYDNVIE